MALVCDLCGNDPTQAGYVQLGTTVFCTPCLAGLPARLDAAENRLQDAARRETACPLELATVADLVAELLRRDTFRGLVVWQQESFKGICRDQWQYRASNCDPAEVVTQLASALETE